MNLGITGATGFLGRHTAAAARAAGHRVIAWSRRPRPDPLFDEVRDYTRIDEADFGGIDALVHLAGEPVFAVWTARRKAEILASREEGTAALVRRLRSVVRPPHTFVCASAVGYYGDRGDAELAESSPAGDGFLADVCRRWEAAAREATGTCRVVSLRIPMVLGRDGGPATLLRRAFRTGLAGRLGSGRQWVGWIHVRDLAQLVLFAAESQKLEGPVNATAPAPVTNREFTACVAAALRRPAVLPVPAPLLRALPGGMGSAFLDSARVLPVAATAAGFSWRFPTLTAALRDIWP